jgi:hypothetical protein
MEAARSTGSLAIAAFPGPVARRIVVTLLAIAALLALVAPADARARRPITLRVEGGFESAPGGVRPLRTIEVQIGKEASRQLAVTKIVNQSSGALGATILDEVARYKPSLRLLGDATLLERLTSAPAGQRVVLTGNLSSGRSVLLSMVEVDAVPSPAGEGSPPAP